MTTDPFLSEFEARREARRNAERTFEIMGETLTCRPSIAPETALRLQTVRVDYYEEIKGIPELLERAQAERDKNGDGDLDTAIAAVVEAVNRRDVKEEEVLAVAEETILLCLTPSSLEAWQRIRAKDNEEPLTGAEMFEIADYLIGRVAGTPTDAPADSSAGRTETAKPSTAKSSSRAKTPTHSP